MKGKQICSYLKSVRREVAAANGIDMDIPECTFQGECTGTCPRCEAEVQQLERALNHRQSLAQKVALIGVAAGLAFSNLPSASAQNVIPADSVPIAIQAESIIRDVIQEALETHAGEPLVGAVDGVLTPVRGSKVHAINHVFVKAEYPEGQKLLQQRIRTHFENPENADIGKLLERVTIRFRISSSGKVYRVKATYRNNRHLAADIRRQVNTEMRRLVRTLPAWFPATLDGKAVSSYREVEVVFW